MSSSPLTMALLGQNGMMPQDPAYLPVARRLGLAQAMMGQGLESGPASPMQALARVVQGGLGAWMQSGAEDQFNDVTKQRQQDTLNALRYMRGGAAPGSGVLPQAQPDVPAQPASAPPAASASLTPLIQQASLHSGVPAAQLVSMVTKESGGKPDAVNQQSGAGGVAQILPSTAAQPGYGVQPISDSDRFDAAKAIPFAADYVAARAKAAGLDMTNPDQAAKAWSMYGGDKTGAYGADVVAKAGGAQPAPGQSGTAPPAAGQPQTGVNAPMVQQGMTMMQRAQDMAAANPYNVAIQHAAAAQIEYAKTLMGMDTFVTLPDGTQMNSRTRQIVSAAQPLPHYVTTPTGSEDTTGTHPNVYAPTPRPFTTQSGEMGAVGPGGQVTPLAANPSGITGSTPESNAMRIMAELGPKVQNGTATPQEKANYATAHEQYVQPTIHVDPATQQLVRLNTRGAPPGFPPPPTLGGGASPGNSAPPAGAPSIASPPAGAPQQGAQQGAQVTPLTTGGRGPATAQAITQAQGEGDVKALTDEAAKVLQGHGALGTSATIRATLPQVTTGVGADQRLKAAQIFTALGVDPKTAQEWVGTNAPPGEILQKKLFELSTGAVRGMGAREPGSVISMFQKNYPNMNSRDMTIDAMTRLLDMDQTYKEDEIKNRGQYLGNAIQGVAAGKPYAGLSDYTPPEPRLYQAAALATGGMPYSVWSSGLTPQQQTNALKLGARIYPDASALDDKGVRHVFQGNKAPAGG